MQESPELAAARETEINAKAAWWQLHEELQDLLQQLKALKRQEVAAYEAFDQAAQERSRLEREQTPQLSTIAEALQESPATFADGFTETISIVTRPAPDPMC